MTGLLDHHSYKKTKPNQTKKSNKQTNKTTHTHKKKNTKAKI